MKKLIALLMAIAALTSFAMAESYDFSTYDTQTLNEIDVAIRSELLKRAINSVASASSMPTHDGEITFRDIPWGTNFNDAKQMLINSGFFSDKCRTGDYNYLFPWSLDPDNAQIYDDCGMWLEQNSFPDYIKVAGYNVISTDLYFMYTLDDDRIKRSADDVELYKVRMWLDVTDFDLSFADLVEKLNSVYGKGEEWANVYNGYTGLTEHNKWATWYGENNTSVLLHMMYRQDKATQLVMFGTFFIYYGKTDSEPQLVAISHALEHEKKEQEIQKLLENASNVDGL